MSARVSETGVLSMRQNRILQVIEDYWTSEGIPPTVRDVARLAGCATSTAAYQIGELESAGRIVRTPGIPRSIRVVKP